MAGRPLKFQSVEDLKEKINKYFAETPIEEWTITGLAIALDTVRSVLIDYEKGKYNQGDREFSNTIKKAKHLVEHSYEIDLKKHGRSGTIFALKNFDWKDQVDTLQVPAKVEDVSDELKARIIANAGACKDE